MSVLFINVQLYQGQNLRSGGSLFVIVSHNRHAYLHIKISLQQTEIINSLVTTKMLKQSVYYSSQNRLELDTHSNWIHTCSIHVLQLPTVTTEITLCYERCLSELLTSLTSENTHVVYISLEFTWSIILLYQKSSRENHEG